MKWETAKLGDYIDILSGYAFKSRDFIDNGIPVIKIKNITPPNVSLDDLSFVSDETAEKAHKYLLNYNDILIALTGSHINQMASVVGRVARVKYNQPSLLNQRVGKIIANDNSKCDIDYVYYYLSQDDIKIKLATKAGGAANQANISPSDVKALDIPFPEYDTQKMISSILLSYDALVENNQKQIKLLEEAAQRLYKEWFVDLRFPGHETTQIVDGMPKGWIKDRADLFFDITIGKTPPRAESQWFVNNGIQWVSISDMGKSGAYIFENAEGLTTEAVEKYNVKIIPVDTVLVSFKLTVGRVSITTENMCTNEAIAHFRVDKELRDYTYLYLKSFEYDNLGNTSAISKAVNSKIIKAMPFIMPDKSTLINFERLISPIMNEIYNKSLQIKQLTEARDRLLPKLMSGEIEV